MKARLAHLLVRSFGPVLTLMLGFTRVARADQIIQVPVDTLLNARAVTTLTGGRLVPWTVGIDGGGLADGFMTAAASRFNNDPPTLKALPDDGRFAADARHPEVILHFSNDADPASQQTRYVRGAGTFSFDDKAPDKTTGRFVAKAASIDTNVEKRDAHLRSQDFFWAEKYPELVLVVKKLTPGAAQHRYVAQADITIRGVTKPVSLDVEYLGADKTPWGSSVASFSAHGTINRKDFGLTWNKALESGGVLVGDEVELLLDVEGVEQAKTQ